MKSAQCLQSFAKTEAIFYSLHSTENENKEKHTLILLFGIIILIVLLFRMCSIEQTVWDDLERFHLKMTGPNDGNEFSFIKRHQILTPRKNSIFMGYYLQPNVIELLSRWWDHTLDFSLILRRFSNKKNLKHIYTTTFFSYFYS